MSYLKQSLFDHCVAYVQSRIDSLNYTIASAQQSANEDTKSSAGDKYETGRAMMQQETDRNTGLLNEASKLMAVLNRISVTGTSSIAETGSAVVTNNGNFYIAVSAGSVNIDGQSYFMVSQVSPIGLKLMGCKADDEFVVNGKQYKIKEVL
jgi:transcription elongation GreA/GreB family factor